MPTVPFGLVRGAAIPKPGKLGKFRTIWNASFPGPYSDKSAVINGNVLVLPIASNAAAVLPSNMAIVWLSIEQVGVSLNVLARVAVATGENIQVRSN